MAMAPAVSDRDERFEGGADHLPRAGLKQGAGNRF